MSAAAAPAPHWPVLHQVFLGEGRVWLYVLKCVLALYLDAWLAMWLQLENPYDSMITVAIVMRPLSGTLLAKSFYRAAGTVVGSLVAVLLMSLVPQQRSLFFLGLALWMGFCSAGATVYSAGNPIYTNFKSYGFMLAGYTAAIVVFPSIGAPGTIFESAVMRVSEILLAVLVAGVVDDVILPDRTGLRLQELVRRHFARFREFARAALSGEASRDALADAYLAGVPELVQLEDMRELVIFEDPVTRARRGRLRLRTQHSMAAATFLQALQRLVERLGRDGHADVAAALDAVRRPLADAMARSATAEGGDEEALAARIAAFARGLPARAAALGAGIAEGEPRLAFDTGIALLRRAVEELGGYATVTSALRRPVLRGRYEHGSFHRGTDHTAALVAFVRTTLAMLALDAFWVLSGWSGGLFVALMGSIFVGLVAADANPASTAFYMFLGFLAGSLAALAIALFLLPGSGSFPMLILATLPFFLIGPWFTAHGDVFHGFGPGFAIAVVFMPMFQNPQVYDPAATINNSIGMVMGVAVSVVAYVFIPGVIGGRWQARRHIRGLQGLVAKAAAAPLDDLPWRFESASRDRFHQVASHLGPRDPRTHRLLALMLIVHETGRALIELRRALRAAALPEAGRAAADAAIGAAAALYRRPDEARRQRAVAAVRRAIDACAGAPDVRSYLYVLLRALEDVEAPVVPPPGWFTEASHAA